MVYSSHKGWAEIWWAAQAAGDASCGCEAWSGAGAGAGAGGGAWEEDARAPGAGAASGWCTATPPRTRRNEKACGMYWHGTNTGAGAVRVGMGTVDVDGGWARGRGRKSRSQGARWARANFLGCVGMWTARHCSWTPQLGVLALPPLLDVSVRRRRQGAQYTPALEGVRKRLRWDPSGLSWVNEAGAGTASPGTQEKAVVAWLQRHESTQKRKTAILTSLAKDDKKVALVPPALGEPNEPRLPPAAEPIDENTGDAGKGGEALVCESVRAGAAFGGCGQEKTRTSHLLLLARLRAAAAPSFDIHGGVVRKEGHSGWEGGVAGGGWGREPGCQTTGTEASAWARCRDSTCRRQRALGGGAHPKKEAERRRKVSSASPPPRKGNSHFRT
ncbi:hypothetical protein B0H14DRAFT_2589916 [Mycena olivaceomarginata]|nr:hypothetical protein B0H14DRAFT_2589916 [Mycena olivaceomarginata]